MLKKFLKFILSDKRKRSIKEQLGVPGLHHSLLLLKERGYSPGFVIDGGAYEGTWTLDLLEVFPEAKVLMVEAQIAKVPRLREVAGQHTNVQYHQGILSAQDGKRVLFTENETASHVEVFEYEAGKGIASETLDGIITRRGLPFPDFIKLDVQGYEIEVLKGASQSLDHAEFCFLEVSLIDIGNEPLLTEVIHFMDERGFQAYDICQLMRRPYDKALYQLDLLFIKKTSNLIAEKRWN